jgi:hypothetical protein
VTHELKTLPVYWDAVERGDKAFEVRRDDRGFQKGDIVRLMRLEEGFRNKDYHLPFSLRGEPMYGVLEFRIRYILTGGQFGIEPGFVVLQLEPADAACLPAQPEGVSR